MSPVQSANPDPGRRSSPALRNALSLLAVVVVGGLVGGLAAPLHWGLELCCHWRVHGLVVLALCAVLLAALGASRRALGCIVVGLPFAVPLAPLYIPRASPPDGGSWRLASLNLLSQNHNHEAVGAWLNETQPAVVIALEVTPAWARQFEHYPQRIVVPRDDNFGIGLWSQFPITRSRILELPGGIPVLSVTVECSPGRECTLLAIHPVPPVNASLARLREQQFLTLSQWIGETNGPLIVAGDFNATSWSPLFARLSSSRPLSDSRTGFGIQPTWAPIGPPALGIPIDHVLVSPGLTVRDRRVGGDIGSDHLPVLVELQSAPLP